MMATPHVTIRVSASAVSVLTVAGVVLFAGLGRPAASQDQRPLPEPGPFLEKVRQHLRSNRALLSQYTYVERETERQLDGRGGVTKEETTVAEVYPSPSGGAPYRRVIQKNGQPVKPADLEKADRERRQKMIEQQERLQRESEDERRKRLEKQAEADRKEREALDEILRVFDVRLVSRELIDGHPTILCAVTPRAGYAPRSDNGKFLKHFAGRVWFSESDYELVRAEAEALDDLTFGLGVLARVHKGSRFQVLRRKVNGEIWLPAEVRFWVSARFALFKRIRAEGLSTYSDYKKFSVQTSTTFKPPLN